MIASGNRIRLLLTCSAVLAYFAGATAARATLPLRFEPNQGQTAPVVQFLARGPGYTLFLTPTEAVMVLPDAGADAGSGASMDVRMQLVDSNPAPVASGVEPLAGTASYFVGNDPALWQKGVPTFGRVRMAGVYPDVDLVYYGREGRLEYDFEVAPGGDPAKISFRIEGADTVAIDAGGDLVLSVRGREVRWQRPTCYQQIDGVRRAVDGAYERLGDDRFGFRLAGYDRAQTLVIDPTLVYATYLSPTTFAGGDGLTNTGLAIAADGDGNAYIAGITESASFPTKPGSFLTARPGKRDVFVTKLNPTATALVYSTYLGGSENEVQDGRGLGIAIDAEGNAYVAGATSSTNFPTTAGAYQTMNQGGDDAFVTKLSPDGAGLVYSTYVGGTGVDYGAGIAVNAAGEAYVCGETNGSFPTTTGAAQNFSSSLSGFVSKLAADGSGLVYSTTLGTNTGKARAIAVDAQGSAYVTGLADGPHGGTSYPITPGAFRSSGDGGAFATKLSPDGSSLVYSTWLGDAGGEDGRSIALDADHNVYVAGTTNSTHFPTTAGAFQTTFQSAPTPVDDGFVIKLNPAGNAAVYATYLGTTAGDDLADIVVDGQGSVIVTGSTGSTAFPTTVDAFQTTYAPANGFGGSAIVAKLAPDGTHLTYSTYLHPTNEGISVAYAIGLDGIGGAYVTGISAATFPTTAGVFQPSTFNPGFGGPIVAKLSIAASAVLCGDANGDGKLRSTDALAALRAATGAGICALSACDFTGDGKLTASDALGILRAAVGQPVVGKCP